MVEPSTVSSTIKNTNWFITMIFDRICKWLVWTTCITFKSAKQTPFCVHIQLGNNSWNVEYEYRLAPGKAPLNKLSIYNGKGHYNKWPLVCSAILGWYNYNSLKCQEFMEILIHSRGWDITSWNIAIVNLNHPRDFKTSHNVAQMWHSWI